MASFNKTSSRPSSFARLSVPVGLTHAIASTLLLFATEGAAQTAGAVINAHLNGSNGLSLGENANATSDSLAIGKFAQAHKVGQVGATNSSVAIGYSASAGSSSVYGATAVGAMAHASASLTVAFGNLASAQDSYAIGIGAFAKARKESSIAIGAGSETAGSSSIALGAGGLASGPSAVAIGRNAEASGTSSVALGAHSKAKRDHSVDVGNRTITSVGAGTLETDATNIQQLKGVASALGGGAHVSASGAIVAPSYTVGKQVHQTIGSALSNLDKRVDENASGIKAINNAVATALVVSYENDTFGTVKFAGRSGTRLTNIAAGDISTTSTDAINGAQVFTLSKGFEAKIEGLDLRVASLEKSAVGSGESGAGSNSNGNGNGSNGGNAGSNGGNGANGNTGATGSNGNSGTDGSNGGNGNTGATGSNGGNGNTGATGSNGNSGTGGSNGGNAQQPGNVVAGANGATAIGEGSELPTDHALSVGAPGAERRITHVADGLNGTDAVNLNQLTAARESAVDQSKRYTDLRFGQAQARIDEVGRTAYSGVAMAMAMPNIAPAKAGSTVLAAGTAGFQGYAALGLGMTYRSPNGQMLLNGAVAYSGSGGTAARVQAGYEF